MCRGVHLMTTAAFAVAVLFLSIVAEVTPWSQPQLPSPSRRQSWMIAVEYLIATSTSTVLILENNDAEYSTIEYTSSLSLSNKGTEGSNVPATLSSSPTQLPISQEEQLAIQQRLFERRQLMQASRSTNNRQSYLDLSRQRAALYNTTSKAVSCPTNIPCL